LVPTSAPMSCRWRPPRSGCVRRSGWCRRRHHLQRLKVMPCKTVSVDQVGADVGTEVGDASLKMAGKCPSIRLVPTSAPAKTSPIF